MSSEKDSVYYEKIDSKEPLTLSYRVLTLCPSQSWGAAKPLHARLQPDDAWLERGLLHHAGLNHMTLTSSSTFRTAYKADSTASRLSAGILRSQLENVDIEFGSGERLMSLVPEQLTR